MPGRHSLPVPLDIVVAVGLLTRLPIKVDAEVAARRGAAAAWAYPLAGLAVALPAGLAALGGLALGLPAGFAAAAALGIQIVLTGAMHEDGLADAADGLWGGWTRERRLEIMKDSRIGSYGVLALVISFALRMSALATLGAALLAPLIAVALLSRAGMVTVMAALPYARADGLARSVGRPTVVSAGLAWLLSLAVSTVLVGPIVLPFAAATLVAACLCGLIARAKIGGQTGDILGATQQVCEIAALACAAAMIG